MVSPKRMAQVGLGAAGLVLVGSVAVLMAGAADGSAGRAAAARARVSHPLATIPADVARPAPSR